MAEFEKKNEREDIYSRSVIAGKRTYYFDVKATRKGDYYLTLTERKRKYSEDGSFKVEKHKLFLYKEDFDKFADALDEVIEYVENLEEGNVPEEKSTEESKKEDNEYSDIKFEDLDD